MFCKKGEACSCNEALQLHGLSYTKIASAMATKAAHAKERPWAASVSSSSSVGFDVGGGVGCSTAGLVGSGVEMSVGTRVGADVGDDVCASGGDGVGVNGGEGVSIGAEVGDEVCASGGDGVAAAGVGDVVGDEVTSRSCKACWAAELIWDVAAV